MRSTGVWLDVVRFSYCRFSSPFSSWMVGVCFVCVCLFFTQIFQGPCSERNPKAAALAELRVLVAVSAVPCAPNPSGGLSRPVPARPAVSRLEPTNTPQNSPFPDCKLPEGSCGYGWEQELVTREEGTRDLPLCPALDPQQGCAAARGDEQARSSGCLHPTGTCPRLRPPLMCSAQVGLGVREAGPVHSLCR